jgi:hypothetical protein
MNRRAGVLSSLVAALVVLAAAALASGEREVIFHDAFSTLDNWRPVFFPRIAKHSVYDVAGQGETTYLKAESRASSSAIVCKKGFDVNRYHRVRWRWKVDNIYAKADLMTKAGDDYPLRVYVLFQYDPDKAGLLEKFKYAAAKSLLGEYPPKSTLSYVWSSVTGGPDIYPSPYGGQTKVIPLERGPGKVGQWVDEEVDFLADYRRAFGEDPPATAGLGIMDDSDNTGEASTSYLAFIEIFRLPVDKP